MGATHRRLKSVCKNGRNVEKMIAQENFSILKVMLEYYMIVIMFCSQRIFLVQV